MKRLVIQVDECAYNVVLGMLQLCQHVEVLRDGEAVIDDTGRDVCMAQAIQTLRNDNVFMLPSDYTWILVAIDQYVIEDFEGFPSPQAFISYLRELGFDDLPHRSTLSRNYYKVEGVFPNCLFSDTDDAGEVKRRNNVVNRFLSAYNRAKRALCDSKCNK